MFQVPRNSMIENMNSNISLLEESKHYLELTIRSLASSKAE